MHVACDQCESKVSCPLIGCAFPTIATFNNMNKPEKIKKIKPNFRCDECGHAFYVQQYTTVIKVPDNKYKDKHGLPFKCPHCDNTKERFLFIDPKKGVPELMGTQGGSFKSEKELLLSKQKQRKIRSKHHFKNEILPKHKDPDMIPYFKKKYEKTKFVDHEKLK